MRDQAARLGSATLARYAEVVHAGLGEMRGATAPRLLLEVVCARLLLPSASDTESALLQRVERIETRLDISIPAGEAAASAPPSSSGKQYVRKAQPAAAPAPAAADPPAPPEPPSQKPEPAPRLQLRTPSAAAEHPDVNLGAPEKPAAEKPAAEKPAAEKPAPEPVAPEAPAAPDATAVRQMWPTVREKIRARSRSTYALLADAIVREVEGDVLVLSHQAPPLAKRLSEQHNVEVIRDALKDALGVNWRVRCEVGGPAAAPTPAAAPSSEPEPAPPDPQAVEEEELIAEAVREAEDPPPRRDPEEVALEILQTELGARRIDG